MAEQGYKIWVNRHNVGPYSGLTGTYSRIDDKNILVGNNPEIGKYTTGLTSPSLSYVYFSSWNDVLKAIGEEPIEVDYLIKIEYTGSTPLSPASGQTSDFKITTENLELAGCSANNGARVTCNGSSIVLTYPANTNENASVNYTVCVTGTTQTDQGTVTKTNCVTITQAADSFSFSLSPAAGYNPLAWDATSAVFNVTSTNIANIGWNSSDAGNINVTNGSALSGGKVTATTSANQGNATRPVSIVYSGTSRSGKVRYATGSTTQNYHQEEQRSISVSPSTLTIDSGANSTKTFTITTVNVAKVNISVNNTTYFSVTPTTGANGTVVTVKALTDNTTTSARTATVTVSDENGQAESKTVSISQTAGGSVNPPFLKITYTGNGKRSSASGTTNEFTIEKENITSIIGYSVNNNARILNGWTDSSVTVEYPANQNENNDVVYTVVVSGTSANGIITASTTFTQSKDSYTLSISPSQTEVPADATSKDFTVSSLNVTNIGYDSVHSENVTGRTVQETFPTVTAKFTANTSASQPRTIKFAISGKTNAGREVYVVATITQKNSKSLDIGIKEVPGVENQYVVDNTGGTRVLEIRSNLTGWVINMDYDPEEENDWVNLNGRTGSGNEDIPLNIPAYDGTEHDRSAGFIVSSTEEGVSITREVTITQLKKNAGPEPGEHTFKVYASKSSNFEWFETSTMSAKYDDETVPNTSVTWTITDGEEYTVSGINNAGRFQFNNLTNSAQTVTVQGEYCGKTDSVIIWVNPPHIEITDDASFLTEISCNDNNVYTLHVNSNIEWQTGNTAMGSSWIHEEKISDTELKVWFDNYEGTDNYRQGYVLIQAVANSGIYYYLLVHQNKCQTPVINIPDIATVTSTLGDVACSGIPAPGYSFAVQVTPESEWKVTASEWITATKNGNNCVVVIGENDTTRNEGSIVISLADGNLGAESITIPVNQEACKAPGIEIVNYDVVVETFGNVPCEGIPSPGTTFTVQVTPEGSEWEVTHDTGEDGWIHVSKSGDVCTVVIDENGGSYREGHITVSLADASEGSVTIDVNQEICTYFEIEDKSNRRFICFDDEAQITIDASDDVSWEVTFDNEYFNADKTSGSGSDVITITASGENYTSEFISGLVTITPSGGLDDVKINLLEDPTPFLYIDEAYKNLSFDADGETKTITFGSNIYSGIIVPQDARDFVTVHEGEMVDEAFEAEITMSANLGGERTATLLLRCFYNGDCTEIEDIPITVTQEEQTNLRLEVRPENSSITYSGSVQLHTFICVGEECQEVYGASWAVASAHTITDGKTHKNPVSVDSNGLVTGQNYGDVSDGWNTHDAIIEATYDGLTASGTVTVAKSEVYFKLWKYVGSDLLEISDGGDFLVCPVLADTGPTTVFMRIESNVPYVSTWVRNDFGWEKGLCDKESYSPRATINASISTTGACTPDFNTSATLKFETPDGQHLHTMNVIWSEEGCSDPDPITGYPYSTFVKVKKATDPDTESSWQQSISFDAAADTTYVDFNVWSDGAWEFREVNCDPSSTEVKFYLYEGNDVWTDVTDLALMNGTCLVRADFGRPIAGREKEIEIKIESFREGILFDKHKAYVNISHRRKYPIGVADAEFGEIMPSSAITGGCVWQFCTLYSPIYGKVVYNDGTTGATETICTYIKNEGNKQGVDKQVLSLTVLNYQTSEWGYIVADELDDPYYYPYHPVCDYPYQLHLAPNTGYTENGPARVIQFRMEFEDKNNTIHKDFSITVPYCKEAYDEPYIVDGGRLTDTITIDPGVDEEVSIQLTGLTINKTWISVNNSEGTSSLVEDFTINGTPVNINHEDTWVADIANPLVTFTRKDAEYFTLSLECSDEGSWIKELTIIVDETS